VLREVLYDNPFGQTIVEECSRKELVDEVSEMVADAKAGIYWDYYSAWVEYVDGSWFSYIEGDMDGRFLKTNISGIIVSNGSTYEVYGDYRMYDDNMNIELV